MPRQPSAGALTTFRALRRRPQDGLTRPRGRLFDAERRIMQCIMHDEVWGRGGGVVAAVHDVVAEAADVAVLARPDTPLLLLWCRWWSLVSLVGVVVGCAVSADVAGG